ncbi:Beta,beta-carotene 9',10'-oxygenase [Choanephora cucurbitarum]|uniref:Beta,beta-carotene 9',10'-oxygenase n=1 Tax=Choanephora cucurbitarum TaxID=101091 RepID=A0A1C7NSH4_9FUNG|nr:Beta,beta-carotene 9',10'-oxygenase [Choanephora cucurbitarum]
MTDKPLLTQQDSSENNKDSLDIEQLQEISLSNDVHVISEQSDSHIELASEINNWKQEEETRKEHPLATASLREEDDDEEDDPWTTSAPVESNHLLQEETHDSQTSEHVGQDEVILDADTSAAKGFQNFQDSDQIDDLTVSGHLPEWLIAEYFTVGPATYDIKYLRKTEIEGELVNTTALYTFGHWFDALPLVNRFDLNGQRNTVTYRNRSTSRRLVEKIRQHHGYAPQHPAGLFMSDTNQTVLSKILSSSKVTKPDAEPCGARVLASLPGFEGRLFAQNFANHAKLDPFDLSPTRLWTWNQINPAFKGTSACPNGQFDSRTGEYINFTLEVGYQSAQYHFFSISDRHPKGQLIGSITAPMAFINTFSITPRYILLAIHPMLANTGGVKFNWNESIMDSFSFQPSEPMLIYVISRQNGQVVATFRSDPCFIFNHVNAFEDDYGNVVLDMICYPDDTIARQLRTEFLRHPNDMKPARLVASELRRYTLNKIEEESIQYLANNKSIPSKNNMSTRLSSVFSILGKKRQSSSVPSNDIEYNNEDSTKKWYSWMPIAPFTKCAQPSVELPQIHPSYKMQDYSFMYGLSFSAENALKNGAVWDSIVKINVKTNQVCASWHQDACYPSEAMFVPRPPVGPQDRVAEDEGVLLSIVMDSARATSFLLVLDAQTFEVLATAGLEKLVPLSFAHGSYRLREEQR